MPSNRINGTGDLSSVSVQFDLLDGFVAAMRSSKIDLERPGVDNSGARGIGKRGPGSVLSGQADLATGSPTNNFVKDLESLEGTIVTVHDAFGTESENVLLDSVGLVESRAVVSGGVDRTRVRAAQIEVHRLQ